MNEIEPHNTIERFSAFRLPEIYASATEQKCENPACPVQGFWKRLLRKRNGGVLLQGRWYCSLDCFEQAMAAVFEKLMQPVEEIIPRPHRVPIGLLLLGRGVLDEGQLKQALRMHREKANEKFGRSLVRLGLASAQDISAALAAQWGCSTFPLEFDDRYLGIAGTLPLALLESSRMLPVCYASGEDLLFLGFSEEIDHSTIRAIEQLAGRRARACVVSDSAMEAALHRIRGLERPSELVFETMLDAAAIARTIRDQAAKVDAEELLIARPRSFLWIRLKTERGPWDLLFRVSNRPDPGF